MRLKLNFSHHVMNNLVVSTVFFFMVAYFLISLSQYWLNVLDPRLSLAAKTQAEILSQSQSGTLLKALAVTDPIQRKKDFEKVFAEILLITDPSINEPFIKGISLEVDYEFVDAVAGSIDLQAGILQCDWCIKTQVALIDDEMKIIAIAHFNVTDAYYRWLGSDLKSELISQALITLTLLIFVWIITLLLMSRLNKVKHNIEISDRAKTRFIANMSHELKTPLNVILGYTQLFKKNTTIMTEQGKGINTIHRSAEHLLDLINDILDFSRVESEHLQLAPQQICFPDFVNSLVEMTSLRAEMKGIQLNYQFSDNLPNDIIIDDKRLRQVLLNLLNNAVKFTEHGSVTFSIKPQYANRKQNRLTSTLHFSVKDTGIGIPKSMLEAIFVPYQQVDNTMTSAEGSGLGLAISKHILELMGSKLAVISTFGQGSEFSFVLTLPMTLQSKQPNNDNCATLNVDDPTTSVSHVPQANHETILQSIHIDNTIADSESLPTVVLPDSVILLKLKEYSVKHNVLAIRQLISELEQDSAYLPFVNQIKPLASNYQFAKLIQALEQIH